METNSLNFFGRELPSSLGYGVLDKSSVKIENEVISADYLLECDLSVVHRVSWGNGRCELKTEFHGEFCGSSWYPDLKHTLTNDFFVRDFSKDPVFLFLSKETSRQGNIWIQHPPSKEIEQQKIIHYPLIIADFIVPLARMWSAAGTFAGRDIIDPRKPKRLIIDESGNAGSTFMQIYPGDLRNPCFAIVFKDCDEKQREGIAKLLSDSLRAKKSA